MSLLIAIVLLISLFWQDLYAPAPPENLSAILGNTILFALLAPAFAAMQVCITRWRHANENRSQWYSRFRIMAIANTIVWAAASIAIVTLLQWSAFVQSVPVSTSVPLADDMLTVAPALLSLIGAWAIFIFGAPTGSLAKNKSRTSVFVLWLRMQVIMVTAPILFAFFITDCVRLAGAVELSPSMQVAFLSMCGVVLVASILFYPQMMLFVWSTRRIEDKTFELRCKKLFELAGIRPRKVRVWKTGNSIVNAAAVGIVPGTEVIIVSDMLLEKFDEQEVDAILLHEIGHIRHRHCIKRIAMVLVPLTLLAIDQATGCGLHQFIGESKLLNGVEFASLPQFLPAVAFLIYLLVVSKTVFRSMEFEADRFAIESQSKIGSSGGSDVNDRCAVELALEKMAAIYPRQIDRRSGLHPSIRQRLAFAVEVHAEILGEKKPVDTCVPTPKSISLDPIAAK